MKAKSLYKIAGVSYVGIFFTAIFANFFVLDSLKNDPVNMVTNRVQSTNPEQSVAFR